MKKFDKKLVFEDGCEYYGYSFGSLDERVLEIVFNTSMAGYQEILSDPSYTYQAVVMTYPLIGNYGMAGADYESLSPSIGALVVHEYNDAPSNFRSEESLGRAMARFNIPGIYGPDTRKLTRSIRDHGSRKVLLTNADTPLDKALEKLKTTDIPKDAVSRVSTKQIREVNPGGKRHIVAIDCGMKENIVRSFIERDCRVSIVPWNTAAEAIRALRPDGVFISNGPGDPEDVPETIATVKELLGTVPIFGICLGHQLISLASGAKTYKLKFGHRGGNHPVKNLLTGKIEITSQNHSYAVREESLPGTGLTVTHVNLLDKTIEGVENRAKRVFSVQYHPESAPGPQDSAYLFDRFMDIIREG
ncbi:MAG: glutamine-hydrolyzing carbamoyl-phosphate synthase small subunit [Lachnospiraceae bacterium]|nr:glutamine-hydrolyzing carbamoyl-phosphate synthase small subunit [Lachnospiraceae bacterium]